MDLSAVVKATGYAPCALPAKHERDGHACCAFHAAYGGDLPFTLRELRDTDPRPVIGHWVPGGPRRRLAS